MDFFSIAEASLNNDDGKILCRKAASRVLYIARVSKYD
jgi:hypothetical protein